MIDSNAEPNIYNKDFLVWSTQTKDKFDIIMGNPPYQGNGRKKIYIDFVDNILKYELLNINKYLIFITPQLIFNYLLGIKTLQKTQDTFYNLIYFKTNSDLKLISKKVRFLLFLLTNETYKEILMGCIMVKSKKIN